MAKTRRPLLLHILAAAVCLLPIPFTPALAYDWLQFGWNPQHSGNNTADYSQQKVSLTGTGK